MESQEKEQEQHTHQHHRHCPPKDRSKIGDFGFYIVFGECRHGQLGYSSSTST